MNIIEHLHSLDTIESMEDWLNQSDSEFLRAYLLKAFEKVKYYETADQWNDAVKMCEALAIIGWGDRERVDAICSRQDQWRWTTFRSSNDDECYRDARWLPRKAGWYLLNYSDFNEPVHSDRNYYKSAQIKEEDIICTPVEKILTQRNYLVKTLFGFTGCLDTSDASWLVSDLTNQLQDIMKEMIDPTPYAHRLESFCVWTSVGWAKHTYKFKPGRYYANRKAYDISLHIDRNIEDLSESEQRLIIVGGVREGVKALIARLKKRKLDFPSAQFEADVDAALDSFASTRGLKALSDEEFGLRGLLMGLSNAVKSHQETETEPTA